MGCKNVAHRSPTSHHQPPSNSLTLMQEQNFNEILDQILAKDSRYHRDAYAFVREALDHTQKNATKSNKNVVRHVSGQELLAGIKDYGLAQFGPMTLTVFEEWGLHRCEDFGEIVFNMVESGLLSKTSNDSRADFAGGYDFVKAFREPFIPARKIAPPIPKTKGSL
jgi:uncharacterized repeat protein (TIGR04138 family)